MGSIKKAHILNGSLAVLAALLLLAPASLANFNGGYVEANLDSITSSYTPTNWGDLPTLPNYIQLNRVDSANGMFMDVGQRVRDDSALVGYNNRVETSLYYFDLSTHNWVQVSRTMTFSGPNTGSGKYNNFCTATFKLPQPYPVTKYTLNLVADTRGLPTKNVWKEFYVAKCLPYNDRLPLGSDIIGNKSVAVRNAAPRWYAERMELAQMLRHLKTEWDGMASPTVTPVNYDNEMKTILQSTAALAGPTTAGEYFQNSGQEVLSLVASVFGSATSATLVSAGGEVYECYQMLKWCNDTLNSSINTFNVQMGGLTMQNAIAMAKLNTDPSPHFEQAANAIEAEANELVRIVYTDPWAAADTWKTLLVSERDALHNLGVSLNTARGSDGGTGADGYLSTSGASASIKNKIDQYFDIAMKLANKESALLAKATQ